MLVQFLDGKGYWIPMQYIFLVEILLFGRLLCGYLEERRTKKYLKVLWVSTDFEDKYLCIFKKKILDKQIDELEKNFFF